MAIQKPFLWEPDHNMGRCIKVVFTGLPGAGKTQALIKVIEMLEEESLVVCGMVTEPIVESGKRVGFYVMDWKSKRKAIFAHIETESKFYVGKYGVNLESLDTVGVEALNDATKNADVIVTAEGGKMEVESGKSVKGRKDDIEGAM